MFQYKGYQMKEAASFGSLFVVRNGLNEKNTCHIPKKELK